MVKKMRFFVEDLEFIGKWFEVGDGKLFFIMLDRVMINFCLLWFFM